VLVVVTAENFIGVGFMKYSFRSIILCVVLFFHSVHAAAPFAPRPQPDVLQKSAEMFAVGQADALGKLIKSQLSKAKIKNGAKRDYLIRMVKDIALSVSSKTDDESILDIQDILTIVGNPRTAGELSENIGLALRLIDRIIQHKHWQSFSALAAVFECIRPGLSAMQNSLKKMLGDQIIQSDAAVRIIEWQPQQVPPHEGVAQNGALELAWDLTFFCIIIAGVYFPLALPSLTKGVVMGAVGGAAGAFAMEGLWRKSPQSVVKEKVAEGAIYGAFSGALGNVVGNALPVGYATAFPHSGAVVVESAVKSSFVGGLVGYVRGLHLPNPLKGAFKDGVKGALTTSAKSIALNLTKPFRDFVTSTIMPK
jgi:hypothetical protein